MSSGEGIAVRGRRAWARGSTIAAALVLLAASACTGGGQPSGTPSASDATISPGSGLRVTGSANPLGTHWDASKVARYQSYLRQVSGSATWYQLQWCDIEPRQGHVDWSTVDRFVAVGQRLGIEVYLKIRIGSCWADGRPTASNQNKAPSVLPADLGTYSRFVTSLVRRYSPRGVHEYAIENEVNGTNKWSGSPQDFVTLTTAAAAAVHAGDPRALVVDSAVGSTVYGAGIARRLLQQGQTDQAVQAYQSYYQLRFGTRSPNRLPQARSVDELRQALDSSVIAHGLTFLDADNTLVQRHIVQVRQVHFYEPWNNVPALVDYLHHVTPSDVPLEAWEVGQFQEGGSPDAGQRSADMVKTVCELLSGGVRRVVWLPLAYNPNNHTGQESHYGLLDPDGTVRGAGRAFAGIATAAAGSTIRLVRKGELVGSSFQHGSQTTLIVWSTGSPARVAARSGAQAGPVGASGSATGGSGITVSMTPVMIRGRGSAQQILS